MKRNTLMTVTLAGLIASSFTLLTRAGDPAPPADRPERAQLRERLRELPPEERRALRERWRNASPEQRQAARERFRDATPEQREAMREPFRQATPEERERMWDRLTQPRRPGREAAGWKAREGGRPPGGPADRGPGPGRGPGAGGPPAVDHPEGMPAPHVGRLQNRLHDLHKGLAEGNLTPDEQRQLARLEHWEKSRRGPGAPLAGPRPGRGPAGPGGRGPGPRPGFSGPEGVR